MSRWHTIGTLAASAAGMGTLAALYALYGEPTHVHLDSFTLRVNKPGLPPGGLRILHLTDLHCRADGRIQERKLANLRGQLTGKPYDLLLVTGDLIHDADGFGVALALLKSLRPRLGAFMVPGNHDYCESALWGIFGGTRETDVLPPLSWAALRATAGRFREFGRKMLVNERVHLPVAHHDMRAMEAELAANGIESLTNRNYHLQGETATGDYVDLWLAGVDDLWEGQPDMQQALAGVPAGALVLMLAHNPDAWLDPCARQTDLVLSGHVHGGQIRLPIIGALHTQGTHLTRRKPAGWFSRNGAHMFVSRGLGESLPLRFGVPPQAALIHLLPLY
jgi:predicted MPP superfamily phosphohydrolase